MTQSMPDDFEDRIQSLARVFPYPATPDLATQASKGRMTNRAAQKIAPQRLFRFAFVIVLLLAAASLLVPSVRAAVLEFLQIGGLRINLRTPTPDRDAQIQPDSPLLAPSQTALPSLFSDFNLAGETSLEQVVDAWEGPILLPGDSSGFGPPDQIFFQKRGAPVTVLLWLDPTDDERLLASLIILQPGAFLSKDPPDSYRQVQVRGQNGFWLQGEHHLILESAGSGMGEILIRVVGNVLVWEEEGFTYRLESFFDLERALAIAETLQPYP